MDEYGIQSTHQVLKDKLIDYITAQYFGHNKFLQSAFYDELRREGVIYQQPFIEANKSIIDSAVIKFLISSKPINIIA